MNFVSKVLAQGNSGAGKYTVGGIETPGGFFDNFGELITSVLNIILVIAVILVLFYLIMGGIAWLTSGGDKGKTESARNQITAAIVGLIIIVAAWAIMGFVQNLLGVRVFTDAS